MMFLDHTTTTHHSRYHGFEFHLGHGYLSVVSVVLSGKGLCDELITHPEESYRLWCIVVCDLETSRIGGPYIYIYDISSLRVNNYSADISLII